MGVFTSSLTGLDCCHHLLCAGICHQFEGTVYGTQVEFPTSECAAGLPDVSTSAISSYTDSTAQGGGEVTDDGGHASSGKGVVWSTTQNPVIESDEFTTDGTGLGIFTQ